MRKTPLLSLLIAASALMGCATDSRQVRFSDGSVLTAKERTGDSFQDVRVAFRTGKVLNAESAVLVKDQLVLRNVVTTVDGHEMFAEEYMMLVEHR